MGAPTRSMQYPALSLGTPNYDCAQMGTSYGYYEPTKSSNRLCSSSTTKRSSQNIGFSVGGAKDINSFRDNILKNGRIPQLESISYEGIFYDYYFETEENEIGDDMDDDNDDYKNEGNDDDDNKEELPLFYPSYMYSKSLIPQSLN